MGDFDDSRSDETGPGATSSEARETPTDEAVEPPPPETYPGEHLLRAATVREVLAKIVEGDPLDLASRVVEQLERGAFLLDSSRVLLRAMAHTARAAMGYRGEPVLEEWLIEMVQRSIREHIEEDREQERLALPPPEPLDPRYSALSGLLGIEVGEARRACVFLNDLPPAKRRIFKALFIEKRSLAGFAKDVEATPEEIRLTLREVLRRLSWVTPDFQVPEDTSDE